MNFTSIQTFACAKVSKTDTYSQARCMDFIIARHRMIYEAYDWKAAQIIVDKTVTDTAGNVLTTVPVPEVHHCISVRFDGNLLDPVTTSYVFDRATQKDDTYAASSTPLYYDEFFDPGSAVRSIRFYPPFVQDGNTHTLTVLGKAPFDETWTSVAVPQTESALIAFVLGDLWEYLHQLAKAELKFQEANALLQIAQGDDKPGGRQPRQSRVLTPNGNTLSEMVSAVADICGSWAPEVLSSIANRIRRHYATLWNSERFPETNAVAAVTAFGGIVVLPHILDRVIAVRVNIDASTMSYQPLSYEDNSVYFGVMPQIFEQTGAPKTFSLLLPSALPIQLPVNSSLQFVMSSNEIVPVFLRGQNGNDRVTETVLVQGMTASVPLNTYDTFYTLTKPATRGTLSVQQADGTPIMTLGPGELGRKYPRIQILPAFDSSDLSVDQSVLVLAKRAFPQLLDDGDTCQLIGAENVLINSAAADMLTQLDKGAQAASYLQMAAADMKTLIDRTTKQGTYRPRVIPQIEPSSYYYGSGWGWNIDYDFLRAS